MKGFNRQNQLFSLCGLNCGLCPMRLNGYCPGCGGGQGNQSCKIARCSMERGGIEYCFQCSAYPCEKYGHIDDFDSFITHQHRKADLEKAQLIGIKAYNAEQTEKKMILDKLLADYNDGRKKTFYCITVNLLELEELREVFQQIESSPDIEMLSLKERSSYVAGLFQKIAFRKNISLKLRKKT